MALTLASLVLLAVLAVVGVPLLLAWRTKPTPLERRRTKVTGRLKEARTERQRIEKTLSSGRVTNPALIDAMQTNLGRARRVIQECEHELEQLEVDETEGRLGELEGD